MSSQVETPAELAGATYAATIRTKAAKLKRELIRQTLDDLESWHKAVNVQWQQAHPDQANLSPIPPEEIERYRNTVRNEYYEWIEPAFARYLAPDPDAINQMIEALRTIESMFGGSQDDAGRFIPGSPALSRIYDVRTDMSQWEGDLQVNFIDNFLTPLQSVSANQAMVAKLVREYLECNKIVYIRCRKSILELVNKSIEAVKTLNNGRDPKSYTWGTLVGIIVGTGLTLGPGGFAITGAVLICGSTFLQGLVPVPEQTNELSAPTAQEVAVKISEAMGKMDSDLREEEVHLERAFRSVSDMIADSRSKSMFGNTSGPLTVATPALSAARPGNITDGSLRPRG